MTPEHLTEIRERLSGITPENSHVYAMDLLAMSDHLLAEVDRLSDVLPTGRARIDRAAEIIAAHVGKPADGGTANGAWVDCACMAEAKGVSRDHATSLHRKHVARALDTAGLLATPEHDAAVAAEALRDAQTDVRATLNVDQSRPLTIEQAMHAIDFWLGARADRFEAGGHDA